MDSKIYKVTEYYFSHGSDLLLINEDLEAKYGFNFIGWYDKYFEQLEGKIIKVTVDGSKMTIETV